MKNQDVSPVIQGEVLGGSIDKDLHYKHTGRMGVRKYLRKNYCHRIKCPAANFLAAFIWRRPLNSTALNTATHRRPEGVFDGTSTRVAA